MVNKFFPIAAFVLFAAIGAALWAATGHVFFMFNFGYIGLFLSLGLFLMSRKNRYARNVVQIGVGLYMLVALGIFARENMQIEGFWFYLFSGVFQAAVIHYLVAKIGGPLIFGRGWCGWACWTAMVLDLLPYKTPRHPRIKKLGTLRYVLFALSLVFVGGLFLLRVENIETIMVISFIVGNVLYYTVGIALAFILKDNRAFCKYLCPVTVFLKPASYFSLLYVKADNEKCVDCGICKKVCAMEVDMLDSGRSRANGTECILCYECVKACPKKALK